VEGRLEGAQGEGGREGGREGRKTSLESFDTHTSSFFWPSSLPPSLPPSLPLFPSQQEAVLQLSAVILPDGLQRIRGHEDVLQMRQFYQEKDLISAEVQNVMVSKPFLPPSLPPTSPFILCSNLQTLHADSPLTLSPSSLLPSLPPLRATALSISTPAQCATES